MRPITLHDEIEIGRETLPPRHRYIPQNSTEQIQLTGRQSVAYIVKELMHRCSGSADISPISNNMRILEEIHLALHVSTSRNILDQSHYP